MSGFTDRQHEQYFEDFLGLNEKGEVFVDVGGFDGFTTLEFIKRCPGYRRVYFFEPELKNMDIAKSRLSEYENIDFLQKGLSNKADTVRFSIGGSSSVISEDGEVEIKVDALDNMIDDTISFIKMDIEGAEADAICTSKKLNNIEKLFIEYHSFDGAEQLLGKILETLTANGFRYYIRTQFCSPRPLTEKKLYLGMDLQLNIFAKKENEGMFL